jgi:small GTP-binding protein
MPPAPKQRKIALVGSRSVGKSSLTVQFVDGHFVESYYPTIENTFSKTMRVKGQDYATEIVDTAGQVWWTRKASPQRTRKLTLMTG